MVQGISDLPEELRVQTAAWVEPGSLPALRLVSRGWNEAANLAMRQLELHNSAWPGQEPAEELRNEAHWPEVALSRAAGAVSETAGVTRRELQRCDLNLEAAHATPGPQIGHRRSAVARGPGLHTQADATAQPEHCQLLVRGRSHGRAAASHWQPEPPDKAGY